MQKIRSKIFMFWINLHWCWRREVTVFTLYENFGCEEREAE